jgi:uncharacterized protein (UPF0248 family)
MKFYDTKKKKEKKRDVMAIISWSGDYSITSPRILSIHRPSQKKKKVHFTTEKSKNFFLLLPKNKNEPHH